MLADIDDDGRPDILVGEMTAGGWSFPLHEAPKILAYRNRVVRAVEKCGGWRGGPILRHPRGRPGTELR